MILFNKLEVEFYSKEERQHFALGRYTFMSWRVLKGGNMTRHFLLPRHWKLRNRRR